MSFFRKLKEFRFYATTTSEHTLLKKTFRHHQNYVLKEIYKLICIELQNTLDSTCFVIIFQEKKHYSDCEKGQTSMTTLVKSVKVRQQKVNSKVI